MISLGFLYIFLLLIGVKRVDIGENKHINVLRSDEKWKMFVMFVGIMKKILKKIKKNSFTNL